MIIKFNNYIKESPDVLIDDEDEYLWGAKDARPFFVDINAEHTKVNRIHIGNYGRSHDSMPYSYNNDSRAYAGRLWMYSKIISFWVYPNINLFRQIIKELENELGFKIFNDGWRIEILRNDKNKIDISEFDPDEYYLNDYYFGDRSRNRNRNRQYELIPIEQYVSSENQSEEDYNKHLKKWQDKEKDKNKGEITVVGFGSDKTAIDRPHNIKYRQALRQENMVSNFNDYLLVKENPDNIHTGGVSLNFAESDAIPFFFEVNSNHTKVERIFVGDYGSAHREINCNIPDPNGDDNDPYYNYDRYGSDLSLGSLGTKPDSLDDTNCEDSQRAYAGRLWVKNKVISFWVYPNVTLFKSIIESLENELNLIIFDNDWFVEVLKDRNEPDFDFKIRQTDDDAEDFYFGSRDTSRETRYSYDETLIPIEQYIGSENPPEEFRIQHLQNWKDKEKEKKQGEIKVVGFGSDKTAIDRPHNIKYRQIIHQENNNYIKESPDHVYYKGTSYYNSSDKAIPFYFDVNEDHTKVEKIYIGEPGEYHGDIKNNGWGSHNKVYPGRLWYDGKLMAFWVYPNETLFKSMVRSIEHKLNIKIFNNGWKIEIQEFYGTIKRREFNPTFNSDYYNNDGGYSNANIKIIPIEDFAGSEPVSEEEYFQHLKKWQDKEKDRKKGEIKVIGFGSDKTSIDRPHNIKWRQALHQENKKH